MQFNRPIISQLLIDACAEVRMLKTTLDENSWPLLHLAVFNIPNSAAVVDVLLRSGQCDVNEMFYDMTALHMAVEAISVGRAGADAVHHVVRRLLAHPGVNTEACGRPGSNSGTPLHLVAERNLVSAVEVLLHGGADANAPS